MEQLHSVSGIYELVAILWDCQNVRVKPEQVLQLLGLTNIYGAVVYKKAYANWHQENISFSTTLYKAGFDCLNIPVSDNNAVDKKLKSDCEREIINDPRFKTIFIISKDKDYVDLIKKFQSQNRKVVIISESPASKKLQALDIDCFLFKDLSNLITNNTRQQSNVTKAEQITYQEAIKCLIEAIKTCLKQGKSTQIGRIACLMWTNKKFPGCQKSSSIIKADGTSFSSFGKFIDAVVKDGKIVKEEDKLFLPEDQKMESLKSKKAA